MVFVEHLLCPVQVQVVLGVVTPWQRHKCLEVSKLHVILRALRVQLVKLVGFLIECLGHILRPLLLLGLFEQLALFRRAFAVAHFSLQVLYLLLQEVVALLLVNVVAGLVPYVLLEAQQRELPVDYAHCAEQPFLDGVLLQQVHLLLDGESHVGADEVERHNVVVDILYCKRCLFGYVVVELDVFVGNVAQVVHCGHKLAVFLLRHYLYRRLHLAVEIRLLACYLVQLEPSEALHYGGDVAVWQRQYLHHAGIYAVFVQVGLAGLVNLGVSLAHNAYHDVGFFSPLHQAHACFSPNEDRRYHPREQHKVPYGKYRQGGWHVRRLGQFAVIAFDVCNH